MGVIDRIKSAFSDRAMAQSARHQAEAEYYKNARNAIRQMMASYRDGIPTRLSTPWGNEYGQIGGYQIFTQSYREMRARARALEMNNVLAYATLDRATENVLGQGIVTLPRSSSDEFNEQARAWLKYLTWGKRLDVRRMHSWGAIQRLAYRMKLRDGDCGILLADDEDGVPRVQLIPGEMIESPAQQPQQGNTIVDGVEMNSYGRPVAYWIRTTSPAGQSSHSRVDARDFIYLHRSPYYNAVRGEPAFTGSYDLFDHIVGYLHSSVVAAHVGASQALLMIRRNPGADYDLQEKDVRNIDGQAAASLPIEPGMVHFLDAESGEDVKAFNPAHPQQQLDSAIVTYARFIGLKFGLTIEQLLLNFERVNYSSSRAARLQANMTADLEQADFAASVIDRWYPWVISKGIANGAITADPPDDYFEYEWIPPARKMVDPPREMRALKEAVELGIDARSYIAEENGYDFEDLVNRNAEDLRLMRENGLTTSTDQGGAGRATQADIENAIKRRSTRQSALRHPRRR